MLEVKSLVVTYGASRAVRGIDLTVSEGRGTALLGANGAGKTSTLRALSGLEPYEGEINFCGESLRGAAPEDIARRGLTLVPEGRRVFAALTVKENLQVGMTAAKGRAPLFSVADVFDLFPPLVPLRTRHGWSLSGGEQQMVAIGRALLASPRLLMLDEPSLGLAPLIVQSVYRALTDVKARVPILLVEQNAGIGLELCEDAYVLQTGTVVLSGKSAELSDRDALLDSYLGHEASAG